MQQKTKMHLPKVSCPDLLPGIRPDRNKKVRRLRRPGFLDRPRLEFRRAHPYAFCCFGGIFSSIIENRTFSGWGKPMGKMR